jgi:hypothetical protein
MSKKQETHKQKPERGTLLSIWLVLMALHGLLNSFLIYYLRQQQDYLMPSWVLLTLFLLSLSKVAAAIAIWYWKRWGLMLYVIAVVAGIAIGLVLTRSQLIVFHDVIFLVITGYLIKDKESHFD